MNTRNIKSLRKDFVDDMDMSKKAILELTPLFLSMLIVFNYFYSFFAKEVYEMILPTFMILFLFDIFLFACSITLMKIRFEINKELRK